jgi:hypothetical protein
VRSIKTPFLKIVVEGRSIRAETGSAYRAYQPAATCVESRCLHRIIAIIGSLYSWTLCQHHMDLQAEFP